MSQLKQSMVDGGLWSAGGRVFAILAAFALNVALARNLPPADYAVYFVVMSTMVILATVGGLGMDRVVVHQVAARRALGAEATPAIIRCLLAAAAGTLVCCIALKLSVPWFFGSVMKMPAVIGLSTLIVLWLFFSSIQRQLAETFRGMNDLRYATLFGGFRNNGILVSLLTCTGVLLLWATDTMTLATAVGCTVAASIVVVLTASMTLARRLRNEPTPAVATPEDSRSGMHAALVEGWPLWLVGLIAVLRAQAHGWFAAAFDAAAQVALFAVAQRFAMLMTAPLTVVNALLPPVVAGLHARGELRRLERVVQAVGGIASLPCIGLLLLIFLAGRDGLGFVFGDHYEDAFPLLLILCIGQVANLVTGSWQVVLPMVGLGKQALRVSTYAAGIQFLASAIGGYYTGVVGVALGASIGAIAGNIMGMLVTRKHVGIWTFISIRREVVVEAVSLAAKRLSLALPARLRSP